MKSEIQSRASFDQVRYANCWEDPHLLIEALEPQGKRCLSIGSAGDNSFSLLAAGAESVTIAELNPAQVACIELRVAAYRELSHEEFLVLHGERAGNRRALYEKCVPLLDDSTRAYWAAFPQSIEAGFGRIGKFESYFTKFREKALPLVHGETAINELLRSKSFEEREDFYETEWNTWRWRLLFKVFFSRFVMGRLGRDPEFFKYVEGCVADRILERCRHALVELDPAENPYLRWILRGSYEDVLPHALRAKTFEKVRENLGALTIKTQPLEAILTGSVEEFDAYNLSDIFEYMSLGNTRNLLGAICGRSSKGARLAYWNMLAPRSRPEEMQDQLVPLEALAEGLFRKDQAFFYSRFVVEEVLK